MPPENVNRAGVHLFALYGRAGQRGHARLILPEQLLPRRRHERVAGLPAHVHNLSYFRPHDRRKDTINGLGGDSHLLAADHLRGAALRQRSRLKLCYQFSPCGRSKLGGGLLHPVRRDLAGNPAYRSHYMRHHARRLRHGEQDGPACNACLALRKAGAFEAFPSEPVMGGKRG